jgi:hypothetical protein
MTAPFRGKQSDGMRANVSRFFPFGNPKPETVSRR